MPVERLRMHVPIAHGREGLDTEKKRAGETGRIQIGDASGYQVIEQAEQEVEADKKGSQSREQPRPADRHEMVEQIAQYVARQALDEELIAPSGHPQWCGVPGPVRERFYRGSS